MPQLNIRFYDEQTPGSILDSIQRIVLSEYQASGCSKDSEFELPSLRSYNRPLDTGTQALVEAALAWLAASLTARQNRPGCQVAKAR